MSAFELKSQLPKSTQDEIDRIEAIASAKRTSQETNFLAALLPYRTNVVLHYDKDNLIIEAEGNTLPTGYEGFKQGAFFRDLDKSGMNIYVNVGDSDSASWSLLGGQVISASPSLSFSPSPSASPSLSSSASPSVSPSVSVSLSPSVSVSASPSVTPSVSVSLSPSASVSPSVSGSLSPSLSASLSPSLSPSVSVSLSPSVSVSLSPSLSPSPSSSESASPSASPSFPP